MASDPAISAALEREYNLRIRHPERDAVYREFAARSAAYRTNSRARFNLRYAAGARCLLDFFPAVGPGAARAPLLLFVHGGYWRALDKDLFSFVAAPYNATGIAVALIGYDLAPAVTITQIVSQARASLAWLAAHAAELGFDPARVVVSGHSAGGHLAATLAAAPPDELGGTAVGAMVGLSGLFDLEPLLETTVNLDARMSPEEALALSPQRFARFHARRFLVAVGGLETAGFIEQSRRFAAHVEGIGAAAAFLAVPGRTHFDLLDAFADPAAELFRRTRALVLA